MSALQETGGIEPPADPLVACLDEFLDKLATAVTESLSTSDTVRIDRIARLEKPRAVTAALQAAESVRFAQSQVAEQLAADVHPHRDRSWYCRTDRFGARRLSPVVAARRLNTAPGVVVRTARHVQPTQLRGVK